MKSKIWKGQTETQNIQAIKIQHKTNFDYGWIA